MGWNEEIRAKRDRRAAVSAEAARLARDPAAGPYLFGALAASLDEARQLHQLEDAVHTAARFAEAGRASAQASATEMRETSDRLTTYATRWPGAFGKDDREHLARTTGLLGRVADGLDGAPQSSLFPAGADREAG